MLVINNVQILILLFIAILCLGSGFFTLIMKFESRTRKNSLFFVQLSTAILLLSDAFNYAFEGQKNHIFGIRVSNFFLFFIICFSVLNFCSYLGTLLVGRDKLQQMPKELIIARIIAILGIICVIISQFNGMYYYIDENAVYHRGSLFIASFIPPVVVLFIQLHLVLKYRSMLRKRIYVSLVIFAVFPMIAAVLQILIYGTSFINISIGISALIVFCQSLVDQNEMLHKIAYEDRMTGLPNSYGYMSAVGKKVHFGTITNYNAYYFDIARMSMINRKYGNEAGDEVIQNYVNTIKETLKEDELFGRLGGNFFVALIRKERTEEFLKLLAGVTVSVRTIRGVEDITVTSVAGVYSIEDNVVSPGQIITNTALAVNLAKNVKKKPYLFMTPKIQKEMIETKKILEQIPISMQAKEFKPYYQPKVNSATGKLVGAEALVRWEHDGEIVPPYKYIPLMEQNESICNFDFYMLDYVCSDIRGWLDEGVDVPTISVNFSRCNLGNPILAEEISNVVKAHNVPPHLVQIEVTETMDEYPLSYLKGVVEALQRYGLTAAIDDFGTGSASIRILRDIPFDVVKIDKSFIDSTEGADREILKCIIDMAQAMGTSVIAEGVEYKEQVDVLSELGCLNIQGFYYDKPLRKEYFEERMAQGGFPLS